MCFLKIGARSRFDRSTQSSDLSEKTGKCVEMESGVVPLRAADKSPKSAAELGAADYDRCMLAPLNPSIRCAAPSKLMNVFRDLLAV